jgi:hypothetical protein
VFSALPVTKSQNVSNLSDIGFIELVKASHPCHRLHIDHLTRSHSEVGFHFSPWGLRNCVTYGSLQCHGRNLQDWRFLILSGSAQLSLRSVLLNTGTEPALFGIIASASTLVCSVLKTAFRGNLECRAAWICAPLENVQVAKPSNKLLSGLCGNTSLPTQICVLPAFRRRRSAGCC